MEVEAGRLWLHCGGRQETVFLLRQAGTMKAKLGGREPHGVEPTSRLAELTVIEAGFKEWKMDV